MTTYRPKNLHTQCTVYKRHKNALSCPKTPINTQTYSLEPITSLTSTTILKQPFQHFQWAHDYLDCI